MQTETSNALHNAIMEAGGKDRPPMLAPGNYVQWKSIIKKYIDTNNNELIHNCLQNQPYKFKWTKKNVLEFGKITSRDGESLESYYSRFYKMMNELVKNECDVTNHQVNVQFLLQLQPEWQRFVTLVKQSQELKTVSYHKLYDILKQHQIKVNEIRAERLARTANLLALTTRNKGKAIVNSSTPIYDQEPASVTEDDEMLNEKEIDKLIALISLSFKKIYKPTNNNLRTSSNTSRANQDNLPRINRRFGYENQRIVNVVGAKENVGTQELEAHYMYMAHIQEVTLDIADNSGPIIDAEPLQKDDTDKLAQERNFLSSSIEKLKCEIDDSKHRVISTTSVSRPRLKRNQLKDKVMPNNSQGKKQQVEDHCRNFKFSNNEMSVTACHDSLNAKNLKWKPKSPIGNVNTNVSMPLGNASRNANILEPMTPRCSTMSKTLLSSNSFTARRDYPIHGTVKFENDQIELIFGYGDLVQGTITIKRVYYVEGLNHNLFSVGQFCDADLEVAFQKFKCYIRDLKGNDLLTSSRGTDLYSITLQNTFSPNLIFLMAIATSSQAWLWHRRLSHLNFDTINLLLKNTIVTDLLKLKFIKDHLCSSCKLGKAKRKSFHTKTPRAQKDGYNFYTWIYAVLCK
nr:integrase, catalytic region, zinc finger, CCHC-type, peptidase aspartic, catalytic [Tanacetum cinerariifolium]